MEYWCIFCSQLADRRAVVAREFENHSLNVNWWHSIHARSFGVAGSYWGPTDLCDQGHSNKPGYVGLAIGHWMLWQHLLLTERPGPFLIFEDDVILADGFKDRIRISHFDLPEDWRIAVVGTQPIEDRILHDHVAGSVYRMGQAQVLGTHAMLLRKSALRFLMEQNHHAELPIDAQLNKTTYRKISSYLILPGLAEQRSQLPADDPRRIPFSCG